MKIIVKSVLLSNIRLNPLTHHDHDQSLVTFLVRRKTKVCPEISMQQIWRIFFTKKIQIPVKEEQLKSMKGKISLSFFTQKKIHGN